MTITSMIGKNTNNILMKIRKVNVIIPDSYNLREAQSGCDKVWLGVATAKGG